MVSSSGQAHKNPLLQLLGGARSQRLRVIVVGQSAPGCCRPSTLLGLSGMSADHVAAAGQLLTGPYYGNITSGTVGGDREPRPQLQDDAQAAQLARLQALVPRQEAQATPEVTSEALQRQLAGSLTLRARLLVASALGEAVTAQQLLEELHPSAKPSVEKPNGDAEQCKQRYFLIETLVGSFGKKKKVSLFPPTYQRPAELLSDEFSGSPLLAAANGGHTGCATLFCDAIASSVKYSQNNFNDQQGKLEYRLWRAMVEAMRLAAQQNCECLEPLLVLTYSAGGRCIDCPTKWLIRNMGYSGPINNTPSPVFSAAEAGRDDCVELLLGTNLIKPSSDLSKSMLRAVELGHLRTVQLLSSYGCNRTTVTDPFAAMFGATSAIEPEFALEVTAREHGHTEIAAFLERSREWTSLHHLEVLRAERARELLRMKIGIKDPPNDPHAGPSPSPLERALSMMQTESSQPPACKILLLASAWSAESHELFPRPARRRAVEILLVGHALARWAPALCESGTAWLDVWANVMRVAIGRNDCVCGTCNWVDPCRFICGTCGFIGPEQTRCCGSCGFCDLCGEIHGNWCGRCRSFHATTQACEQ